MKLLYYIIRVCTAIFLAGDIHAVINCPDIYMARGSSRVISCQSNRTISSFYWYRGTTSTSEPILGLHGGQRGGTEYGSEHFDIFLDGSIEMKNVKIEHESYYTFVGFFNDANFDKATFWVGITVTPDPLCPVISGCSHCVKCIVDQPKKSDTLTCSVTGARPFIPLSWNITLQSGISFVKHEAIERKNREMDSWNTYLSLDYVVTKPCGVHAELQCKAEDIADITSSTIAALEISNERCSDDIPATDATPIGFRWRLTVVLIVVILAIITCISIFCFINYNRRSNLTQGDHSVGETFLPLLPSKGQIKRESLVKALATFYGKFCFVKPLPWGEPIPIEALYTEFQCVVTPIKSAESILVESDDLSKITSSEDLFASSRFMDTSRAIFIADLGYGKTTMTQQIVQRWIKEETAKFILIYIQLKDGDITKSIAEIVMGMLPGSMNATAKDIEKLLAENKSLILMDGLDELSMSVKGKTRDSDENNGDFEIVELDNGNETRYSEHVCTDMNVGHLLKGEIRMSKMRVWVTSREVDDMKMPFPPPHVKIKMTEFSSNQVDAYLRKTCQYYCQFVKKSKPKITELLIEDVVNQVKDILEKDDIIQEFSKTPLLLVLIIHILTGDATGAVTYFKDLKLTKLTTLIRTLITCLESRYVQKMQDESIQSKIEEIEKKLGELAWQHKLKIENYDREGWDKLLGTENVKMALSIGLLRLSKDISNSNVQMRQLAFTSFTGVEFYHQYFLEYLAGQYFSTEGKAIQELEKSLKRGKDDRTLRFVQFMSGCGHPSVKKVSKIFLKDMKMWNNFIDFIYEEEDQEKVKSYLVDLSNEVENLEDLRNKVKRFGEAPVVNFKYLDKKYHQDAVTSFCEKCNSFHIKIRSFTFRQDCSLNYLTNLVLPQLKRLELFEMVLSEKDFVCILEWISQQKLPETFQFTKCTFKVEKLSDESKEKIKNAMKEKELNIHRNEVTSQLGITVDRFNVEKGEWETKFFPKEQ